MEDKLRKPFCVKVGPIHVNRDIINISQITSNITFPVSKLRHASGIALKHKHKHAVAAHAQFSQNYLDVPTGGNLTMVDTTTIVPFPRRPTVKPKTGLSAGDGDAGSGVLVPPVSFHGCHVLGQLPKSVHSPVHPGINSTQNKTTQQSPRTKTGSLRLPLVRWDHVRYHPAQDQVQQSTHNSSASSRLVTCSSRHRT